MAVSTHTHLSVPQNTTRTRRGLWFHMQILRPEEKVRFHLATPQDKPKDQERQPETRVRYEYKEEKQMKTQRLKKF